MAVLQWFVDLGASVMLPIIVFIFALILGTKVGKACRSGLTVGIGFIGLNLVIDLLTDSLGPAAQAMVDHFGLELHTIDIGWPATSAISYGSVLGSLAIPIGISVNSFLLMLGWTKTLNIDLWNYWHCAFTGSLVYSLTGDFVLGLLTIVVHLLLIFLLGDFIAKDIEAFYGFKQMTFPHAASAPSYLVAKPLNWLFDRIPRFNRLGAKPETIQKRFGIFGDSTMIGILIGGLIGILAGYSMTNILQLAMHTGAIMLLMPKMVALLMEGLAPVSEAAGQMVKKRFPGRDLYIGMDSALSIGHPAVLSASLIMIPLTLLLAVILPGNRVLPFGDLATIPFLICLMVPVFRGNIVRTVIAGSLYITVGLYIATWITPLFTDTAIAAGFETGGHSSFSSLVDGAVWTTFMFISFVKVLNWYGIGIIGFAILMGLIYVNKIQTKRSNKEHAEDTGAG
ncbi:PTS transporter subunit IIC [Lentibacillus sp. N15]|uniref:PTS galactitol transporter subunit IIC n=1 Tax=Lentibacillus songyuanensis TaxID=3136161 RepID=UPI0031BA8BE6